MSNQRTQSTTAPTFRAQWLPGFGIANDYALCDTDATHIVHVAGTYALPFGTGKAVWSSANRLTNAVIGGWQMNAIYSFQTGAAVDGKLSCDNSSRIFLFCPTC